MTLFTVGCSFTFGEELPDPATQAWPALLAGRLGIQLVNKAKPGVGNEYLIKKTMQFVPRLKPDLVAVSWTSCGRVEFSDDAGTYTMWPGVDPVHVSHYPMEHRRTLVDYLSRHNNDIHEHRRWLRDVILLQDYLKLRDVNYFFLNNFDNQTRNRMFAHRSRDYTSQIDTSRFIGWPYEGVDEWIYGLPRMPKMHPGPEAHALIADRVYEFISQTGSLPGAGT